MREEDLRTLRKVILTFDVEGLPPKEDYFDNTSASYVTEILDLLEEKAFKGIFFLTGIVAERIRKYPDIVKRLSSHEIGYHSSSHGRPTIIEYTDIDSYEKAIDVSLNRETSRINSETGQILGKGGILALRETFPKNEIRCFRAPFLAWSPPHLEALKRLNVKFDFSSDIFNYPTSFRGITFFPYPIPIDGVVRTIVHKPPGDLFLKTITGTILQREVTVLLMHPSNLCVKNLFSGSNETKIAGKIRTKFVISFLRLLLNRLHFLQSINLINVVSLPNTNWFPPHLRTYDIERICRTSVREVKNIFGYNPRFIFSHFKHFFDTNNSAILAR